MRSREQKDSPETEKPIEKKHFEQIHLCEENRAAFTLRSWEYFQAKFHGMFLNFLKCACKKTATLNLTANF